MLLVDTRANAISDLHVTTTRKQDTQIAPSLIRRNTDHVAVLLGVAVFHGGQEDWPICWAPVN